MKVLVIVKLLRVLLRNRSPGCIISIRIAGIVPPFNLHLFHHRIPLVIHHGLLCNGIYFLLPLRLGAFLPIQKVSGFSNGHIASVRSQSLRKLGISVHTLGNLQKAVLQSERAVPQKHRNLICAAVTHICKPIFSVLGSIDNRAVIYLRNPLSTVRSHRHPVCPGTILPFRLQVFRGNRRHYQRRYEEQRPQGLSDRPL